MFSSSSNWIATNLIAAILGAVASQTQADAITHGVAAGDIGTD